MNRCRSTIRIAFFLAATFCFCVIASGQKVRYNFVQGTDFSKYKTYKWVRVEMPNIRIRSWMNRS
jgi:hypothetical protein